MANHAHSLPRPAKFRRFILADPGAHDVDIASTVKRNNLARSLIDKLAAVLAEDASKAKICTATDRQEGLVNVGALKDDLCWVLAVFRHQQAMPLTRIWYRLSVRDLTFHAPLRVIGGQH